MAEAFQFDVPWFGDAFDVGPDAENVASIGESTEDAHNDLGGGLSLFP